MSLKHAILAVLSHSPRTGYELTQKVDGSIANFWPASHQQIYLELKKLDDEGLVSFAEKEQKGKPNKKVYSATKKGISVLKEWISEPTEIAVRKDPFLIKLFASHLVKPEIIKREFKHLRELHLAKLTEYREIETNYFSGKKIPAKLAAQYLTLRRGILFEESWIKWCDESLLRLTDLASDRLL